MQHTKPKLDEPSLVHDDDTTTRHQTAQGSRHRVELRLLRSAAVPVLRAGREARLRLLQAGAAPRDPRDGRGLRSVPRAHQRVVPDLPLLLRAEQRVRASHRAGRLRLRGQLHVLLPRHEPVRPPAAAR